MNAAYYVLLAFFSGAVPWSLIVGRAALRRDIREVGDGNPGASNVIRAGGRGWGALAILLDSFKALIPVALAHAAGLGGTALATVAVAPVAGHAFSPFLRFRGGKAVASTFGAWAGLTVWEGPTVLGFALLVFMSLLTVDGWTVMFSMSALLLYLAFTPVEWNGVVQRPDFASVLLPAWLGMVAVLAWKHRGELRRAPRLKRGMGRTDV